MKISATQYAQVLYETTKEKSHDEINDIISNFIKNLARNKQIKNVGKIIVKFREIYNRENEIVEAEVTTRGKLDKDMNNYVINYVTKKFQAKKVELKNIKDETIKGGVIIRIGDEVMDGSINRNLQELKKTLVR